MSDLFNVNSGVISEFKGEYAFLSNFYKRPVVYEGITYGSTEAAYQAQKCSTDGQKLEFTKLTPSQSKQRAKIIAVRDGFYEDNMQIMYDLNMYKFTTYADLKEKLLATGDKLLIEGNTWGDRFWGQVRGVGENYLGIILMLVRQHIRDGISMASEPKEEKPVLVMKVHEDRYPGKVNEYEYLDIVLDAGSVWYFDQDHKCSTSCDISNADAKKVRIWINESDFFGNITVELKSNVVPSIVEVCNTDTKVTVIINGREVESKWVACDYQLCPEVNYGDKEVLDKDRAMLYVKGQDSTTRYFATSDDGSREVTMQ